MGKIIACIDGSEYSKNVCDLSIWAANKTGFNISLLHVAMANSQSATKSDLSGAIGLGARSAMLEKLTKIDEERAKLEQKKGKLILEQAKADLVNQGIFDPEILHYHGSLVDNLVEIQEQAELIIVGKRGENSKYASSHLGSNLERVARAIHKPLLVANKNIKKIKNFLIAYDGSSSSKKAVDYIANNQLLKGLKCHLLKVSNKEKEAKEILNEVKEKLEKSGFEVQSQIKKGAVVEDVVDKYIINNQIDLLIIGAYGHSKIRNLILGSTTTKLITKSTIPLLLFR